MNVIFDRLICYIECFRDLMIVVGLGEKREYFAFSFCECFIQMTNIIRKQFRSCLL